MKNTEKDNRTKLQKRFEEQTPTIVNVRGKEYLQTYCTWLELQVEKANDTKQTTPAVLNTCDVSESACDDFEYVQMLKPTYISNSGVVKKCMAINNTKRNGWFAPISDLP